MHRDATSLNTRFGRRLFLLFAGCALLPILGLALISYGSVNRELVQQAEARLADTSKSLAMGIWERLAILDAELQIVTARLDSVPGSDEITARSVLGDDLSRRFRGIVSHREDTGLELVLGQWVEAPALSSGEGAHLGSGRPLLRIIAQEGAPPRVLLARYGVFPNEPGLLIWSEIEPAYLWWGAGQESTLPAGNELVVLDPEQGVQLYSTLPDSGTLPASTVAAIRRGSQAGVSWKAGDVPFLGHYRLMNLRPAFHHSSLTLVVSEPEELAALPLESFKRAFLGVVLATLAVVLLLSLRQIRSSLVPLERLRDGTRRVASGDFRAKISVSSDDEFAELADSFNSMATSLERQFETLSSLNELQQSVLSSLKIDHMVTTILEQFQRVFPCTAVAVCVMNPDRASEGLIYHERSLSSPSDPVELLQLSAPEVAALEVNRDHLVIDLSQGEPSFLPRGTSVESRLAIAFPAFLKEAVAAIVVVSCRDLSELTEREFAAGRQVTDQVAIGLTNMRLIHDLDNLNWSTLSALARAIDVRSRWTMGHTERVTRMARQIGKAMNLPREHLDSLHRGCLLHDIGKIGVRSEVLDKASSLTTEEMEEIRLHVTLGIRIIEPIPALADAIPIVLQHHEWFNGEGYPAGLAGDEICLEARILAIADCYDALRSARPYRDALGHDQVMQRLQAGAGTQFDPQVIEVFVSLMERTGQPPHPSAEVATPCRSKMAS